MEKLPLIIWGTSGHAKVVLRTAQLAAMPVAGFASDLPQEKTFLNYPVKRFSEWEEPAQFVVAIGNPVWRRLKHLILHQASKPLATLIHPQALVDESAKVAEGSVVLAGAIVGPYAKIGEGCIINHGATIDHDCELEPFVHVSPGSHLAGDVHVEEGSWIGIGSSVVQGVRIGSWAMVGAGSVVIQSLQGKNTYAGAPARIITGSPYFADTPDAMERRQKDPSVPDLEM